MSGRQIAQPPYGDAYAGRSLRVVRQVEEKLNSDGISPKDISSSRWTYVLRAFDESVTPHVKRLEVTLDKSTADAATGWIDSVVPLGATAYERLRWEVVEIDTSITDADAPTGKVNVVLEWWYQPIRAKPATT